MAAPALHASPRESLDTELRGELDPALSAMQRDAASNVHEEQDLDADRTDSDPEVQGSNACPPSRKISKRPRLDLPDLASTSARTAVQSSVNLSINVDQTTWDTDATDSEPELQQSRLRKAQLLAKGKKRWMRGRTKLRETEATTQLQSPHLHNRSPKSASTWSNDSWHDNLESGGHNTNVESTDSAIYDIHDDDERTDSEPEPATRRLSLRPEETVDVVIRTASEPGALNLHQSFDPEAVDEDRTDSDLDLQQEGERTDSDTEFQLGIRAGVPMLTSDVIQRPAWSQFYPPTMKPMLVALQLDEEGEDTDSDVELMTLTNRGFKGPQAQSSGTRVLRDSGPALCTFFVGISAASSQNPGTLAISIPSEQLPEEDETTETDDEPGLARTNIRPRADMNK